MNLCDTTPDFFFANLFRDYLDSPSSVAAGVPDASTVPIVAMDMGLTPALPSIIVSAKEDGSKGARRMLNVSVILLTQLKAADPAAADVPEQTTRLDASGWIGAIDRRLRMMQDVTIEGAALPGFRSFLSAFSPEQLQGWRITRIAHNGLAPAMRNKDTRTIFYAATMDLHVVIL